MSKIHKQLGEFLKRNTDIDLHLLEYLESTRFAAYVREQFQSFCNYQSSSLQANPWNERREMFRRLTYHVRAYDVVDWSRPDYWRSIQPINKAVVRSCPDTFLNSSLKQKNLWVRPTSGTTGPPVNIWYSQEFYFDFILNAAAKICWVAGFLSNNVCRQAIFCIALVDNKDLPNRVWANPNGSWGLTLRLKFDERSASLGEELNNTLAKHQPALLTLKPNILRSIIRNLSEPLYLNKSSLKLVISTGAPLDDKLRAEAEQYLGIPVFNAYGLSEFGVVASECTYKCGLHLYSQYLCAEVLLEDGNLADQGVGELVLSSIANEAMPLLRYQTGDIVELRWRKCHCGREGTVITSIAGRVIPSFTLPDTSEYYPVNLKNLFKLFPLQEFQVTQTRVDHVLVEVEFFLGEQNRREQLSAIRRHIEKEIGPLVAVSVLETQFHLDNKFQRYRTYVQSH